ncbi:MAG: DNA polymerase III subunit delta' [Gammaproteobacteria bacterium]
MHAEWLLPWLREPWEVLSAYIRQQRIPQALIISGPAGLGKIRLATGFAQALQCIERRDDGRFCGRCHRCHLFQAGTHPDVLCLEPEEEGKVIGIDQIRALIAKLLLKPQFETWRVAVIYPAEQMNRAAANAFLKYLEEPTERTLIILVTAKPFLLPATISSRCQKMPLGTPDRRIAVEWLRQQQVTGDPEVLLNLAQGSPLLAKSYAERKILEVRNECFKVWLSVAKQRTEPSDVAENWYKSNHTELLAWLISWTIDLIRCRSRSEYAKLDNTDIARNLQDLAQSLDLKKLFGLYDLLLRCNRQMSSTLNKQLLFEEILIYWSQLNNAH